MGTAILTLIVSFFLFLAANALWQGRFADRLPFTSDLKTHLEKLFNKGVLELDKLNYSNAATLFDEYIMYHKENPFAYFLKGYAVLSMLTIRRQRGETLTYRDWQPAIWDISTAISMKPDFADAYFYRGLALAMHSLDTDRDFSASRKSFEKAHELGHKGAKEQLEIVDFTEQVLFFDSFPKWAMG